MTIDEAITRIVRIREYLMQAAKGLPCISPDGFHAINMAISALEHQNWIPCSERMPEEHDTAFTKYKGTEKWNDFMFAKASNEVLVTAKFEDGTTKSFTMRTFDGKWVDRESIVNKKIVAWMPLPEPYREDKEHDTIWAYKKHHIPQDIMLDVDRVKAVRKRKDRLTPDEVEACRELITDDRERALFELMLSTGMRVGEINILQISDLDLLMREIHIPGYKSESSDRNGVLTIKARNALARYIGKRTTGYVFQAKKITETDILSHTTIEAIAKRIGRRAGVHLITTVHVYRKTFASDLFQRTHDVKLVSVMLGHADTRVTEQNYLVDDMDDMKARMKAAAA